MDVYYLITLNSVKTGTMSVLESSHIKHSINVCFKNYYCGESLSMGRWQDEKKIHAFSILFFFFFNKFIYLFLAALGLHCHARAFSSCERGLLFLVVRRLLVAEHGL